MQMKNVVHVVALLCAVIISLYYYISLATYDVLRCAMTEKLKQNHVGWKNTSHSFDISSVRITHDLMHI